MNIFKRLRARKQRRAIIEAVKDATRRGSCVILSETPTGTRIIVCGKDKLTQELEAIAKEKQVEIL